MWVPVKRDMSVCRSSTALFIFISFFFQLPGLPLTRTYPTSLPKTRPCAPFGVAATLFTTITRRAVSNDSHMHRRTTTVNPAASVAFTNAKNRRLSLDQTNVSPTIYCEGYARIKRRNALSWNTRFLVLSNTQLLFFQNKHDASYRRNVVDSQELVSGRVSSKNVLGIELSFADGRELVGRVFNRADQAQWVSAFYQLAMKSDVCRLKSVSMDENDKTATVKRRVSFFGSVLVRTIPTVPENQVPELFYSKRDMEKFSERASSLRGRTEDAMSLVFRKPWC